LKKAVYTTGEAAEVCNLSQQTIIRCFDNGQLKGFRVPGSKFRRIPHHELITFMKGNNIPLDKIGGSRTRVLVVDDDPEIVELFVDVLSNDGRFEVETASTGYDAGLKTQTFSPDVVVLDYMLPDINGNQVCQSIRQNPDLDHIRILIISGMVDPGEVETLKSAGADDFIKKPFNIETVVDRILELVHP
jgi:excisionase family DNA binding protein